MIDALTYDQLVVIQEGSKAIAGALLIVAAIYLVLGLINPARFGLSKRRWVVVRAMGIVLSGVLLAAGALFFTHSHPNGPHSFTGYLEDFVKHECLAGKDLPACKDLKDSTPPRSTLKTNDAN